ncbi:methylated-DNA--[protein]-cysteine S-methyltransferase [Microvirga sp. W0021]|uniref:Methylated-DNA--protein-cysteine methyltransferase n=1 Tax=Hohaiivirga grylli TaxID=3133970 RepID=A0ABV0BKJ6_9HYPH
MFDNNDKSLSDFGFRTEESPIEPHILIHKFETLIGPMIVCATEQGICLLEFTNRRILLKQFSDLQRLLKSRIIIGENRYIRQVRKEITEYLDGNRQSFDVPLHMPGTEFRQLAWKALLKVPYGKTLSYLEQAENLGKPAAVRAVAAANGANRIAIIVPCHRLVAKDGSLVDYGGGLDRKRWLLEHERKYAKAS